MKKKIVILGSTGSIGNSTLKSILKDKSFNVKALSTNSNVKELLKQAIKYKVKDAIIENRIIYEKYKKQFKKKNINLHLSLKCLDKIIKKKVDFCVNAITGIDGLYPSLTMIPLSKNFLIANKESIICGWDLISDKLSKYKTNFIPLDSEHFSIWELLKSEDNKNVEKVILTASGGPFLNKPKHILKNVKPEFALNHPKWKMGKKISIDSSTMMNKIFEIIEAKKIFNLSKKKISILIHPDSFIHAIIYFKGNLIKILAHNTNMQIPISNALGIKNKSTNKLIDKELLKLNNIIFKKPTKNNFPLLSIIKLIPDKSSYFETILITLNDYLVQQYLDRKINYLSLQLNVINLLKRPYFKKYYKLKPKNIYDIKKIINMTKNYISKNLKHYE